VSEESPSGSFVKKRFFSFKNKREKILTLTGIILIALAGFPLVSIAWVGIGVFYYRVKYRADKVGADDGSTITSRGFPWWGYVASGLFLVILFGPNIPEAIENASTTTTQQTTENVSGNDLNSYYEPYLNEPASQHFTPGEALITLQQVWGIEIFGADGPGTVREVSDDIYQYLCNATEACPSQSELDVSFQPGNSLQSFFSRLTNNTFIYDAIRFQLTENAKRNG